MRWKPFCINLSVLTILFVAPLLAASGPPQYNEVPDFALTTQSGKALKRSDLIGSVWIADFIFTRCQGMCPLLTGHMASLEPRFSDPKFKLVSFSVDPDYDTPAILTQYASRYGAKEDKWLFLTGPKTQVWNLITAGFQLGVEEASAEDLASGSEPVMHSSRFVLVDREGYIRGYYDSSEPEKMSQLAKDAATLLQG